MRKVSEQDKGIARWLMIGVIMIVIQVLIGGITRLTESGLSITEWKPITGALPPSNRADWMTEFEKYRQTDQFKYINQTITLSEFKFIYFWEWMHRQWARLLGVVFIVGFVYFLVRKRFKKGMVVPMIILFLLGALQGLIGWIMVASGLVPEKYYVGHVELTTHFLAALILLAYTQWFAMSMSPTYQVRVQSSSVKNFLWLILVLLFIQLGYGGFMAGLKAAQTAPTWPDINGAFAPATMLEQNPVWLNFVNNPLAIHFVHRGLAYLLLLIIILFFIRSYSVPGGNLFSRLRTFLLILTLTQVLLGIFTVLNGTNPKNLIWFGVSHQFVAMLMVMCITALHYITVRHRR